MEPLITRIRLIRKAKEPLNTLKALKEKSSVISVAKSVIGLIRG